MTIFRTAACGLLALALLVPIAPQAHAQHTLDGNIFYSNGSTWENASGADCADEAIASLYNDIGVDPLLGSPVYPGTNWVPGAGSIADVFNGNDLMAEIRYTVDACADSGDACGYVRRFETPCYRGAVPPASVGADWTQGWTCYDNLGDCRGALGNFVFLNGAQPTSNWTAGNTYVLQGKVFFPAGTTLTIDPGVIVLGENATQGYLAIDRGAQIFANGTSAAPIVMTTDLSPPIPGGWGGLVIHGRAIANCADCLGGASCVSEGGAGDFCGTNDCDNSGRLNYVRVQYAGVEISTDNELNAFTFNGVGSGTEIDYLQAHMGSDDCFEFFGGTANVSHLVGTGGQDDGFDWQMGFRGTGQFVVIQMWDQGDRGIEADNNEFGFDAICRSNPLISNLTLVGPGNAFPAPSATQGICLRRGTDAQIFNSIIMEYPEAGIRYQHPETCARGVTAQGGQQPGCEPVDAPILAQATYGSVGVRSFPNPITSQARFSVRLPAASTASLDIYDVTGRQVANVFENENLGAGESTFDWSPSGLVAGTYFYRLETDREPVTGKLVLVR